MLPTPSTSHVNYDRIYEPAEDSFLLLDTLSSAQETQYLQARFPSDLASTPVVLEVGTGSGVVLAFVTAHAEHIFRRSDVAVLGVDINHFASAATVETIRTATATATATATTDPVGTTTAAAALSKGLFLGAVVGDLTSAFRARTVDMLIFNPPYVPSERVPDAPATLSRDDDGGGGSVGEDLPYPSSFERDSHMLYLSTDGGVDGMEVTERLLAQLPRVLSDRGVAYILLCAQNRPEAVMARVRSWDVGGEWAVEKVGSSGNRAGWERLCIVRIARAIINTS